MDYQETTERLTEHDIKQLKKNVTGGAIFGVFAIVFFGFMVSMIGSSGDQITYYIIGGFGLFFFGIIAYIIGGSLWDIRSGHKTIYTGKLTNKERYKSSSAGKKSKSTPKHFFYFGEKKLLVSPEHFHQASVGDEIALHYGRHSSTSLEVIHLNPSLASSPSPKDFSSPKSFLQQYKEEQASVQKKEYPMDESDLRQLRKIRNRKIWNNLFLSVFFTVFALVFSLGVLLGHWLFLIPEAIFLIIIYKAIKWIYQCVTKYQNDKGEGVKIAAFSKVKDKMIQSGRARMYAITTTYGTFSVSKEEYDKLSAGDQIFTFHGKHSNWLIGVKVQ